MRRFLFAVLAAIAMSLGGCRSGPTADPHAPADAATLDRNHGYALLSSVISDESDVDKVLIIKRPAAPVKDAIKAIGDFARTTKSSLDTLAKEDPPIDLKHQGLPAAEAQTRDAISSATSKQIIFHSGKDLEFRLLLTQHEALNYITHLARTTATLEPRENRRRFLSNVAEESDALHERVLSLMKEPYTGHGK